MYNGSIAHLRHGPCGPDGQIGRQPAVEQHYLDGIADPIDVSDNGA